RLLPQGIEVLAPPTEPVVFLGTADSGADAQALYENSYALLGAAAVKGGSDLQQALEQGKEVGAAVVVVYGRFDPPSGQVLDVLPYRRHPHQAGSAAAWEHRAPWTDGLFATMGRDERFAAYWGKTPPAILGVICRFEPHGEPNLQIGVRVDAVADGSPAACAG